MLDDSSANEDSTQDAAGELAPAQKFIRNPSLLKKAVGGGLGLESSSPVSSSPPGSGPYFPPGKSDSFDDRRNVGNVSTPVGAGGGGNFAVESAYINTAAADIQTEPLEKFWEMKVVRDKRLELDKKLETLRKKHEKDRKAAKPPKKSHQKLVKRISSKNL